MPSRDEHKIPDDAPEGLDRSKTSSERNVEINSRFGMSKEAARKEMDKFRGVAEYETRKIFGQRSSLKHTLSPPSVEDSGFPTKKSVMNATESALSTETENSIEILERAANE